MKALLKAQRVNKSDRHDARGIAQMMRVGLFKPVRVKTLASPDQRMLLTARKLVHCKMLDVDADLRGTLRNFGLKVGMVGRAGFEARIHELVEGLPRLVAIVEPLLTIRRVMRQECTRLHEMLLDAVRHDPVCRRLMTAPGVGAVVALTYRATVDQPQRFHAPAPLVGRDRLSGRHFEVRRHHAAHDAVRGRADPAHPEPELVVAEGLRHAGRAAAWHAPRHRRRGAPPGGDPPPHVERRHRLPLGQRARSRRLIATTRSSTVLPRQEEVLTGTKVA